MEIPVVKPLVTGIYVVIKFSFFKRIFASFFLSLQVVGISVLK